MLRIALSAVLGGMLIAGFAHAQPSSYFGFGEAPPRPPAAVPNGTVPPQPPPPLSPAPQYPGQTTAIPPGTGPAPSGIQAQPLPPPPGGAPLPPGAQRARVAPPTPGAPGAGPAPPDAQPPAPAAQPDDTVITEMPTQKIENTRAVFAGLDKITGRIISFELGDRRDRAIRRVKGYRTHLLYAPADGSHQHGRLRRSRRSDPARRDQAHLQWLDVCRQPRSARRRTSDLRYLVDGLLSTDASGRAGCATDTSGRSSGPAAPAGAQAKTATRAASAADCAGARGPAAAPTASAALSRRGRFISL